MAKNIIFFDGTRPVSSFNPVSPGLEIFEESIDLGLQQDRLFIDKLIIVTSGSGYTSAPSVVFNMISGSVFTSASAFSDIENGAVNTVRLTNTGIFSTDAKISGSLSGSHSSGATIFISTTRTKRINSFATNQAVYDSFKAAKDKIRLLLYTKKGEIPRAPEFGTRIYEILHNFNQVDSVDDFINKISVILADDLQAQIPEIEILEIVNNEVETDLNKNKIGISIIFKHKLQKKTDVLNASISDEKINLIREHFENEDGDIRNIQYLR